MEAVISGQAGIVAFIRGDEAHVHTDNDRATYYTVPTAIVPEFVRDATDTVISEIRDSSQAWDEFNKLWTLDRALRLLLILLDKNTESETRQECADCLEEMLPQTKLAEALENILFAAPLPSTAVSSPTKIASPPKVHFFLNRLFDAQPAVRRYSEAYNRLPNELFADATEHVIFRNSAINTGAFRVLVDSSITETDQNLAIFECYRRLKDLPNHRAIIGEWTKSFARNTSLQESWEPDDLESEDDTLSNGILSRRAAFENALKQQNAIIQKLESGQIDLARRFANELAAQQTATSGPEYAAKSLCRLAQEAKRVGAHSLQLEWAQRAATIAPEDPIARGHAADALVHFHRLDEALHELECVERYGDAVFAATRRANVLRIQNRFDEALAAFDKIVQEHPESEEISFVLRGTAETLRETWAFDEALKVYADAHTRFPDDASIGSGRAALLAQLGRLPEALQSYDLVLRRSGSVVARNGRASVLAQMGRFHEAIEAYSETKEQFPDDPVAYCGSAAILQQMAKLPDALKAYREIKSLFPYSAVAYGGYADVLRELGRFQESQTAYELASKKFPYDPIFVYGLANLFKYCGELNKALATFDEAIRSFPYDMGSRVGRADVLKRLHKYDDSLEAYDYILSVWPNFAAAQNAKAAVLILLNKLDKARNLVWSREEPQTFDDWVAYHLAGIILFKSGNRSAAVRHLNRGIKAAPFARIRGYLSNAVAMINLQAAEYAEAEFALKSDPVVHNSPVSTILKFHAAAAQRKSDHTGLYRRLESENSPLLVEIRERIAKLYASSAVNSSDARDLREREIEAVILEAA